jgi:hypothetical protein
MGELGSITMPVREIGKDYNGILVKCRNELQLKTAIQDRLFKISKAGWDIDQDRETLTFSAPGGIVATCPVQIIGTYNTKDKTWLWGWDHPSVVPALQKHAQKVKAYGTKHGYRKLTTRKVRSSEDECWEFTALAAHLCKAQGAYRGEADSTLVFMTFGDVTLTRKKPKK